MLLICKPPCICGQIFETHLARLRFTNAFFLEGGRLQPIRCLTPLQPITRVPPHEGFLPDVITARNRVYPWFIAVVDFAALPVELVELSVYASVAVMLTLKTTKFGGGYTVWMF